MPRSEEIIGLIEEFQPDVIFDMDNAELQRTILCELCYKKKIPCMTIEYSKFGYYKYPSFQNAFGIDPYFAKLFNEIKALPDDERRESIEYIKEYREANSIMNKEFAGSVTSKYERDSLIWIARVMHGKLEYFYDMDIRKHNLKLKKKSPMLYAPSMPYIRYYLEEELKKRYLYGKNKYFEDPVPGEDYVFMPLNVRFRNWGNLGIFLAISINLVVIGMWHGANWTYVLFGVYHSLLFLPLILAGKFGKNKKLKPGRWGCIQFKDLLGMIGTHILMALGHIIIFSAGVPSIIRLFSCMIKGDWSFVNPFSMLSWYSILAIVVLLVLEWFTRNKEFAIQRASKDYTNKTFRLVFLDMLLALTIVIFSASANAEFVYFQF